jgi:hypothetical protein
MSVVDEQARLNSIASEGIAAMPIVGRGALRAPGVLSELSFTASLRLCETFVGE